MYLSRIMANHHNYERICMMDKAGQVYRLRVKNTYPDLIIELDRLRSNRLKNNSSFYAQPWPFRLSTPSR